MVRTKLGKLAALARMFVARSYNIGVGLLVVGESKKTWPSLTTAVDTMIQTCLSEFPKNGWKNP